MAQTGIQGACSAWRNAVNLLANAFGLEPLHTRAPRRDFEKLLGQIVHMRDRDEVSLAKEHKAQAYKDLELVRRENDRLRSIIADLKNSESPTPPRALWMRGTGNSKHTDQVH